MTNINPGPVWVCIPGKVAHFNLASLTPMADTPAERTKANHIYRRAATHM